MKTRAAARFRTLHPDSHTQFRDLVTFAKTHGDSMDTTKNGTEIDKELSNMMRNKILTKFRDEDSFNEIEKRNKKMLNKNISWNKNLIEVQIVIPWHNGDMVIE